MRHFKSGRSILFVFLLFFSGGIISAQNIAIPGISVINSKIQGLPGVQSFVIGLHNGEWLIIGGRLDGLHQRQPFAAFLASENNNSIFVINPNTGQVWSHNLLSLPTELQEQLQSTNMEFHQNGEKLLIMGGYGYSATKDEHVTYNGLIVVDLPSCIEAVKSKSSLSNSLQFTHDNRVQITGGQLGLLNGYYYLVGGQKFEGRYNPMGPDHGPGFIQQYSNAIRKFKIQQTKDNLSISDYTETIDTAELHRRDYNMMPQIFPDGSKGFTVFSGVFQYKADLPWLNTIDISPNGYKVIPEFEQRFNQYHCAKTALYDPTNNISYNIFYGGISRFYLTQDGNLVDDLDVPFVKSISLITRDQNGNLNESSIGNMPDFLGASAEFIPDQNLSKFSDTEILTFNPNNPDSILIGYIFGGIKSSSDKVFWINTGTQSEASNQIYKVYLHQKATSIRKLTSESLNYFKPIVYPNPAFDHFVVEFNLQKSEMIKIDLTDLNGKLMTQKKQKCTDGLQKIEVPMTDLPDGNYIVTISNGKLKHSLKIMK
jgi:hypothetical protein